MFHILKQCNLVYIYTQPYTFNGSVTVLKKNCVLYINHNIITNLKYFFRWVVKDEINIFSRT